MPRRKVSVPAGFQTRLIACRQDLRWKQVDLAERAGLSVFSVNRFENGSVFPDTMALLSLADALDVSLDYLVYGRGGVKNARISVRAAKLDELTTAQVLALVSEPTILAQ